MSFKFWILSLFILWFLSLEKLRSEELWWCVPFHSAVPIHPDLRYSKLLILFYSIIVKLLILFHIIFWFLKSGKLIRSQLLSWISSFVLGRFQRVIFRGHNTDWVRSLFFLSFWYPSGFGIGALLFTIYANDFGLQLTSGIGQFADDTFLYRVSYYYLLF